MKVALFPFNPIVGDFKGNLEKILAYSERAVAERAQLAVFPELALIGYPPQDILLRTSYADFAEKQIQALREGIKKISRGKDFAVIVGGALPSPKVQGLPLINAAIFIHGDRLGIRAKSLIPHYDIFHEQRYFLSALDLADSYRAPIEYLGEKFGILICEDSWHSLEKYSRKPYAVNPSQAVVDRGAQWLVNISASPYAVGKKDRRRQIISETAKLLERNILYVNQCGANDELIFDGDSFIMSAKGDLLQESEQFREEILIVDSKNSSGASKVDYSNHSKTKNDLLEIKSALELGIRDYVKKNNFSSVALGLSGGIDSALVATLAVDALGADKVFGFTLPSKFSSSHSIEDAEILAKYLGIRCQNFSIKFLQGSLDLALKPYFQGKPEDSTEENTQSRLRGIILMAMANKFGHLLLTTGNKSELSVGYSTLYGDMCGGLAPIGDLWKMNVYALAKEINSDGERIPLRSIEKAPSAELRPNQSDQDSLPPYKILDRILYYLVEEEMSYIECVAALKREKTVVFSEIVREIEGKLWRNEFKRHQYPPVLRISEKAFGIGRRYPLTKAIPEYTEYTEYTL